jgi:hypothetical protein
MALTRDFKELVQGEAGDAIADLERQQGPTSPSRRRRSCASAANIDTRYRTGGGAT